MMERLRRFGRASWEIFRNRYFYFAFPLAVGATLIVSGTAKIAEGSGFVDEVAEFDLLPDVLNGVYGSAVPWVEVIVGGFIDPGAGVKIGLCHRHAPGFEFHYCQQRCPLSL